MSPQALYDLSPLVRMMLAGVMLALGPIVWVWWRNRGAKPVTRLHALTLITLFLTFDLVLFGAFTRLTDSGLGCPDWPGCYGNASPLGAHADITAAQIALPGGPVTRTKAWIEMIHRYLATGVGVLVLVLTVATWLRSRQGQVNGRSGAGQRRGPGDVSPWWAIATLVWICVQGAFGALTVTMRLFPAIVTLHLMGGLLLLALLTVQVSLQRRSASDTAAVTLSPVTQTLMWLAIVALVMQVALGGWVSTNYAVLACNEFPRCQGSWWPEMNFEEGFQIWRKLGLTKLGEHVNFAALTAIHYAHRLMAVLVLSLLGVLAWQFNGTAGLRAPSRWLAALTGLQLATGLSNVVLGWPLVAALLHTGGAAALVMVLTWAASLGWRRRTGQTLPTSQSAGLTVPRLKHE
jgi:heme a synthase